MAQFGETGDDLHFHVLPRTAAVTREFLLAYPQQEELIHGPVLFDWARTMYRELSVSEETRQVLAKIRERLSECAA